MGLRRLHRLRLDGRPLHHRGASTGGLDVAMPGPQTVYGEALAAAVRDGRVEESDVDDAVRSVLRLAARVGVLDGAEPAVDPADLPATVDGDALAREIARRSFVLRPQRERRRCRSTAARPAAVALIGAAARDARVLGGGSADGLPRPCRLPAGRPAPPRSPTAALSYAVGADPSDELAVADQGFALRAVCRDADGTRTRREPGCPAARSSGSATSPRASRYEDAAHRRAHRHLHPARERRAHLRHPGPRRLHASPSAARVLFDGRQAPADDGDPFEAFFGSPVPRGAAELTAGEPVEVSLTSTVAKTARAAPCQAVAFTLVHREPAARPRRADRRGRRGGPRRRHRRRRGRHHRARRVRGLRPYGPARCPAARTSWCARVAAAAPRHRRGRQLRLPGGAAVARRRRRGAAQLVPRARRAARPSRTSSSAPRSRAAACPPPGRRPDGRPGHARSTPSDGELPYDEGVFIGYRAWEQAGTALPPTPSATASATPTGTYGVGRRSPDDRSGTATVRLRNTGHRARPRGRPALPGPDSDGPSPPKPPGPLAGRLRERRGRPGRDRRGRRSRCRAARSRSGTRRTDAWRLLSGTYAAEAAHAIATGGCAPASTARGEAGCALRSGYATGSFAVIRR